MDARVHIDATGMASVQQFSMGIACGNRGLCRYSSSESRPGYKSVCLVCINTFLQYPDRMRPLSLKRDIRSSHLPRQ